MAEEKVTVEIFTADAVSNLAELKEYISNTKKELQKMELGSADYQKQLDNVITAQNLLRSAMNGTSASMEDLKTSIDKNGKSYNALVNQMAALKREFRATSDVAQRENLAAQIKDINTQLKELDAQTGSFKRNVGDYLAVDLKGVVQDLPSGLSAMKGPLGDVQKSVSLISKEPILGIIGLLAPIIQKIVDALKENDAAMAAVRKAMDALKPVMDFFGVILDQVVGFLTEIIEKVANYLGSSGILNKVIQGVMGVGNAILQYVIAPFKGIIAAVKVFQEEGVGGLRNAGKAFLGEMKHGISFKENYNAGVTAADTMIEGAKSRKKEAKKTGQSLAKETADGWEKEMNERVKKYAEKVKARAEQEKYVKDLQAQTLADLEAFEDAMDAEVQAGVESTLQWLEYEAEAEESIRKKNEEEEKKHLEKKKQIQEAYLAATTGIMGAIADALESGTDVSEGQTKAAKNLRIAAATIEMLQGAVAAYSTAQSLGPIAGPIVGAANAAAVVAAGLANINKIRSTQVSKDSAPSVTPATVSAPSIETAAPQTVVTGASTETALNNAAQPQRVYILQSDIEAAGNSSKVRTAEASF